MQLVIIMIVLRTIFATFALFAAGDDNDCNFAEIMLLILTGLVTMMILVMIGQ